MNIIITGRDIENINNPLFIEIFNKEFPIKDKFYLARILDRLQTESKIYFAKRQELIQKYIKRHTFDNKEINKSGEIIAEHKKGDPVIKNDNFYFGENLFEFTKQLNSLSEIEIDLGISKRQIDIEAWPGLTPYEITLLMPYVMIEGETK